jgi:hypothetical protein
MSDQIPTPAIDPDVLVERWADYEKRLAELHPANKASLFAALAAAGVTRVTVSFNGCGDEGCAEEVLAFAGETGMDLPDTPVEIQTLSFGSATPVVLSQPLAEAIETLADALLDHAHDGWENGEGAFGEFILDVAALTITLDFNERFVESTNHTHEF